MDDERKNFTGGFSITCQPVPVISTARQRASHRLRNSLSPRRPTRLNGWYSGPSFTARASLKMRMLSSKAWPPVAPPVSS